MTPFPPKRILVPMDLSEPSFSALETAKSLARRCGASLDLVYVQEAKHSLPVFYPDGVIAGFPDLRGVEDAFRKFCARRLREALRDFPAARARVRTVWGPPVGVLGELAGGRSAGLVVMGTHGQAGLRRLLQGSVAEAVVRRATVPVLAVHERKGAPPLRRILVPCNLTPHSAKCLAYAAGLAKGVGARLEALYVAPEGADRGRALGELRRHAGSAADSLRVAFGDPRAAILERAREGKFDLVALSAHRRPFSGDLVIGSTVERVLRHCPVPVLAVPSGKPEWREVELSFGGVSGGPIRLPV